MTVVAEGTAAFTVEHFQDWTRGLVLDSGEFWELEDFQLGFVEDLFSGFTASWLIVPEGNGKTTFVSGLALYFCEFRPGSNIPVAASTREQAQILYLQAEGFVVRTPHLHESVDSEIRGKKGKRTLAVPRFDCLEGYRRVNHVNGSRIQVFSADDKHGDGVIPTLAIIDELHRHRNLALYRTWLGKLRKRGGQMIVISTAGEPGSEFEDEREKLRQSPGAVKDGSFTRAATSNGVLHDWAVADDGDVEDFGVVAAANPFSALTPEVLADKFTLPGMSLAHWRRFTCNLPTRAESAAISESEWHAAVSAERIPEGEPVWAGLDLGWKMDTTALVPLWLRDAEFRLLGEATILEPPMTGAQLDPHLVKHALGELHRRNPLIGVVMDMTNGAEVASWIEDELSVPVFERSQRLSSAVVDYEAFMEALRMEWLKHSGDPGLTRHVLNAIARVLPGGQTRFERPHRSRNVNDQRVRVIDALVAAAMAHSVAAASLVAVPDPGVMVGFG